MRAFTPGLRFFLPVEVVDGHDAGHIVLQTCGKQFALPAALLAEAGEFLDETEAEPRLAPLPEADPLPVVGASAGDGSGPLKPVEFVEAPAVTVSDDRLTWSLTFTVLDPSTGDPKSYKDEIAFCGAPSGQVEADTRRALSDRGEAWLLLLGYGAAAFVVPPPSATPETNGILANPPTSPASTAPTSGAAASPESV